MSISISTDAKLPIFSLESIPVINNMTFPVLFTSEDERLYYEIWRPTIQDNLKQIAHVAPSAPMTITYGTHFTRISTSPFYDPNLQMIQPPCTNLWTQKPIQNALANHRNLPVLPTNDKEWIQQLQLDGPRFRAFVVDLARIPDDLKFTHIAVQQDSDKAVAAALGFYCLLGFIEISSDNTPPVSNSDRILYFDNVLQHVDKIIANADLIIQTGACLAGFLFLEHTPTLYADIQKLKTFYPQAPVWIYRA